MKARTDADLMAFLWTAKRSVGCQRRAVNPADVLSSQDFVFCGEADFEADCFRFFVVSSMRQKNENQIKFSIFNKW